MHHFALSWKQGSKSVVGAIRRDADLPRKLEETKALGKGCGVDDLRERKWRAENMSAKERKKDKEKEKVAKK